MGMDEEEEEEEKGQRVEDKDGEIRAGDGVRVETDSTLQGRGPRLYVSGRVTQWGLGV